MDKFECQQLKLNTIVRIISEGSDYDKVGKVVGIIRSMDGYKGSILIEVLDKNEYFKNGEITRWIGYSGLQIERPVVK